MAEPVTEKRRYHSPRRREQAAATRRAILAAAQRLFERDGYAATSIAAIATEAEVAVKTVYLAFETKAGLLRALWHLLLRGDEGGAPVGEREWFREVLAEPDNERALRLNARNARRVRERAGGVLRVVRDAAAVDREIAALWEGIQSEFHANQRAVVASLDERGALREGLDIARAADLLWTLNNPAVYWLLVEERGWSPGEHEEWLARVSCSELLG
jgi:AcrR family transcriptional regulator